LNLIQPVALWALAAVPLILILYILRPRHRRLIVPSIRLWQQLPGDLEGRPRWRLPISSLLLLAQLVIAGAVAFALARPALPGAVRQHLIVLLDTSPTMAATDVAPNRLGLAMSEARDLTNQLTNDDLATLISIEPNPRVLAAGNGPHALEEALPAVVTAPERGDFDAALLLASQIAQLSSDTHNRIVILSDGSSGPISLKAIGSIPADVSFQQIGGSDDNQAITALSVRPMIGSANRFVGFVQVANYAHQDVRVAFQAQADGLQVDREQLTVPSRGHLELSLPLPVGTRHIVVSIDGQDVYGADDRAEVLVPDSQPIPVTLVASDPGYWERAFRTISTVALTTVPPGSYKADGAAITVFDQFVPSALPLGAVVLVQPSRGNPFVEVTGDTNDTDVVHLDPSTPLFDSIDLAGLILPRTVTFGSTPWATVVADSSKGPVVLDGIQSGHRMVVLGFDPGSTDWIQRPSFPVFVANMVENIVTAPIPPDVLAGAVLDLPSSPGASNMLVQLPNGKVDVFNLSDRPIRFADTGQLGRYTVTYASGSNPIARQEFVVNRLGLSESSILPTVDATQVSKLGGPTGRESQHEIWPWVAGGVLGLLGVEWLAYFSRHVA
jgi:Ca-activated chloride channel family protein